MASHCFQPIALAQGLGVLQPDPPKLCQICGDKALSCNFGCITCESCKAFFRRNAHRDDVKGQCDGRCKINMETRSYCKSCRLEKCFTMGMKKELILTDEQRAERKRKILLNRQKRKNETSSNKDNSVASSEDAESAPSSDKYDKPEKSTASLSLSMPALIHHSTQLVSKQLLDTLNVRSNSTEQCLIKASVGNDRSNPLQRSSISTEGHWFDTRDDLKCLNTPVVLSGTCDVTGKQEELSPNSIIQPAQSASDIIAAAIKTAHGHTYDFLAETSLKSSVAEQSRHSVTAQSTTLNPANGLLPSDVARNSEPVFSLLQTDSETLKEHKKDLSAIQDVLEAIPEKPRKDLSINGLTLCDILSVSSDSESNTPGDTTLSSSSKSSTPNMSSDDGIALPYTGINEPLQDVIIQSHKNLVQPLLQYSSVSSETHNMPQVPSVTVELPQSSNKIGDTQSQQSYEEFCTKLDEFGMNQNFLDFDVLKSYPLAGSKMFMPYAHDSHSTPETSSHTASNDQPSTTNVKSNEQSSAGIEFRPKPPPIPCSTAYAFEYLTCVNPSILTKMDSTPAKLMAELSIAFSEGFDIYVEEPLPAKPTFIEVFNQCEFYIKCIVRMVSKIGAFAGFCTDDQINLLKSSIIEIIILHSVRAFDVLEEGFYIRRAHGFDFMAMDSFRALQVGSELMKGYTEFALEVLRTIKNDGAILMCLVVLCLFRTKKSSTLKYKDTAEIERCYKMYMWTLCNYMDVKYGERGITFDKTMQLCVKIQKTCIKFEEALLQCTVEELSPLLNEMLELSKPSTVHK